MGRIQTDDNEPIFLHLVDSSGDNITASSDIFIKIMRNSDGLFLDFGDDTFKSSGHTDLDRPLSESNQANAPGMYELNGGLDTSVFTNATADDTYLVVPAQSGSAAQLPSPETFKVGGWADDDTEILDAVNKIAIVGAAINKIATSVTVTTGIETGVVSGTFAQDTEYHQVAVDTDIDVYYEFALPSYGVPTGVSFFGRVNRTSGLVTTLDVQAWNWSNSVWDGIGTLSSVLNSTSAEDATETFALLTSHVGTGANLGKVRVRFEEEALVRNEELFTNQLFVSYSSVYQSVGYAEGKIWIDTVNGVSGTTAFFNGVADNPVDSLADATTLAAEIGLRRFNVGPNSSLTLGQSYENYTFEGEHWMLNLNDQTITESTFIGADLDGSGSATTDAHFDRCEINSASLPPCHMYGTKLAGRLELTSTGTYYLDQCSSGIAGNNTPSVDFNAVDATSLNMRHYSGGVRILNMTALDAMSLEGHGQLVLDSSCTGGAISLRGHFRINDQAGDVITITDDQLVDFILDEALSDHVTTGSLGGAVQFMRQTAGGRWKIDENFNQMILFAENNTTEIARFNLLDSGSVPSSINVFERVRT